MCTEKDKLGMCGNVCQTVLECQINVTDLLEMMSVTDGCVFAKSQTHTQGQRVTVSSSTLKKPP